MGVTRISAATVATVVLVAIAVGSVALLIRSTTRVTAPPARVDAGPAVDDLPKLGTRRRESGGEVLAAARRFLDLMQGVGQPGSPGSVQSDRNGRVVLTVYDNSGPSSAAPHIKVPAIRPDSIETAWYPMLFHDARDAVYRAQVVRRRTDQGIPEGSDLGVVLDSGQTQQEARLTSRRGQPGIYSNFWRVHDSHRFQPKGAFLGDLPIPISWTWVAAIADGRDGPKAVAGVSFRPNPAVYLWRSGTAVRPASSDACIAAWLPDPQGHRTARCRVWYSDGSSEVFSLRRGVSRLGPLKLVWGVPEEVKSRLQKDGLDGQRGEDSMPRKRLDQNRPARVTTSRR